MYIREGILKPFFGVFQGMNVASLVPWVQTRLEGCQTPSLQDTTRYVLLRKFWDANLDRHCIFSIGGAKFPKGMPYFLRKFGMGEPNFAGVPNNL